MSKQTTPSGEAQDEPVQTPEITEPHPRPAEAEATGAAAGQEPPADEEGGSARGEAEASRPRPKPSARERIDQLTAKRRDAERRAEAAEERARRAEEKLQRFEQPAPNESDFASEQEFQAALTAHHLRQLGRQEREGDIAEARAEAARAEEDAALAVQDSFLERAAEFAGTVPDFYEKVSDGSLPIPERVGREIMASAMGPEIAYFLASNRGEAARLSRLSKPQDIAREIGRLEGRLSRPAPRTVTAAPAPVRAIVTGSGSQSPFDPQKASIDEMEARLKKAGVIS